MKKLFLDKGFRTWTVACVIVLVLALILNGLAINYSQIISIFLGGDVAHEAAEGEGTAYFAKTTASKEEANQKAQDLTLRLSEEGTILLKNESALPLAAGASVSVFGKNSVKLVYGGSGSGGGDTTLPKKTLYEALEAAGFSCNPTLKAFYEDNAKSGNGRAENPSDLDSGKTVYIETGETPQSSYESAKVYDSLDGYRDAAIVVFSRVGGEGFDLPMNEANGANHYLSLDQNEKDLLAYVTNAGFGHVIVVLNTLNVMETGFLNEYDGKIDGCLWIGGPGSTGIMALGEILAGTVTPSGHTTDTWAYDFRNNPTFNNFSDRGVKDGGVYLDENGKKTQYYFTSYEESVYVGYRYYETRAYEEKAAGNASWYETEIAFPFGYGLSYTTFSWELSNTNLKDAAVSKDNTYTVSVKVTNTGSTYSGKDVVQLYAALPYTKGGVEKPYVVLCGYAKTPLLAPGESATVDMTFDPYDIASYDYQGITGSAGYVLEKGDYTLYIGTNAHEAWAGADSLKIPFKVAEDIRYDTDPVTGNTVENRYTNCEDPNFDTDTPIKDSLMSRTDITKLPDEPKEEDRQGNAELFAAIDDMTHNNPNLAELTKDGMPTQGAIASLEFGALIQYDLSTGKESMDYNDARWEEVLNAISYKEMLNMFNQGAFKTNRLESINKPQTMESDGPVGWCNFIATDDSWKGNNVYTSEVVMSATWNIDLVREMGECVGEEALWGAATVDGRPYSGWYAPGVNIHRSPFGGRNFEYFSEDPFLTGTIASAEVAGCKSKGVYCYVKHFILNEQETHRNGVCTWVTEQALRELYLKPFERIVKNAGATAIMTSFNRIGTRWTGGDYRLVTGILRNEWGFIGTVVCDYNQTGKYMNARQMIYAGGDLNLCSSKTNEWSDFDKSSVEDMTVLRMATKNILYTVGNSNAVNSLNYTYTMAPWKIGFIIGDIVLLLALIVTGVLAGVKAAKKAKAA
ncbi:MAG: glycoside hydrolase family 3 C-terminal domain-containing protein [Lachnospiraceae bacterium]|nr:glycoside hydrolase family 3 C-terminal domain-containing protein [Lachnospiraceae bacterium]